MKQFYLILIAVGCCAFANAQVAPPQWNAANVKIFGGENSENFQFVLQTRDRGFLLGGALSGWKSNSGQVRGHMDTAQGGSSIWIVHTDSTGKFQWSKTIGGLGGNEQLQAIGETDNYYVLGGSIFTTGTDFYPITAPSNIPEQAYVMWISKTDGTIANIKGFHGPTMGELFAMQVLPDNKIIIGGAQAGRPQPHSTGREYWIALLKADGSLEWEKNYGSLDEEVVSGITYAKSLEGENEYYVTGTTWSKTSTGDITGTKGGGDVWALKLNKSGDIIWKKCFGSAGGENSRDIVLTTKNKLVFTNTARQNGGDINGWYGMDDIWVFQTDLSGNMVWSKCFGGSDDDNVSDVAATADGGVIVAGYAKSTDGDITQPKGRGDFWLLRLDENGNKLWQKSIGTTKYDVAPAIALTCDNGYALAGFLYNQDADFQNVPALGLVGTTADAFLVLLKDQGLNNNQCIPSQPNAITNLAKSEYPSVFPQPVFDKLYINMPETYQEATLLSLSDATGKLLLQQTFPARQKDIQISTSGFSNGIYLLNLRNGSVMRNIKVIIR